MAKFAFLYFGDETEYAPSPESERVYGEIFKWFETNHRAGRFVDGGAELQPTRTATAIRRTGGKASVIDGPFVESKEAIGGYSVIEAKDMTEAVELAKTWPGQGVEIRPIREG